MLVFDSVCPAVEEAMDLKADKSDAVTTEHLERLAKDGRFGHRRFG